MVLQSRCWCFTINNYTNHDTERLTALESSDCIEYVIFAKEVGESGTPHYQGFVKFTSKKRLNGVKRIIGDCHLEVARNPGAAIQYCKKDGDFTEFGCQSNDQGKRTDLEAVKEDVLAGHYDLSHFLENHSSVYASNKHFIVDYIRQNRPKKKLKHCVLRKWQADLWNILKVEPDDRKILFYVDYKGNAGKSWFARYYSENNEGKAQIFSSSKFSDMAFAYDESIRVLFIDVPRLRLEFFPYDFLEAVKNGYIFSSKYNSQVKVFNPPHLVVFMNQEPQMDKLSADRYVIVNITNEMCELAEGLNDFIPNSL